MTAHVEIALNRRDHILAVPAEAVTTEDGREICYVAHDDGLERREVKLGEGTRDFLEISEGLREGEQVVLRPVLSEVEQDTNEESPLVSEATFSELIAAATAPEPAPEPGPARQVTALH
jgi:multidrug efflux pump subunit AcrA (membrane-fusion protein)